MSYGDDLKYQALLLIQAAHSHDASVGAAAYEAAWDSGVDPIHIAQYFASILAQGTPLARVEEELAIAAAAVAADFPDQGELKYPSPRGKFRKPRR
ncbi:hypothetical protein ACI3KS_01865 [Microbacterium sp. ZW T5_45]|uniref:hypothetical protein n=1 Tax=Microbacterium sp. ZW T5_45 TaxID=3378080 RepID=UPI003853F99C